MKVLVAFERSGRVRNAFNRLGIEAISCDLFDSDTEGLHVKGDVMPLLKDRWDLVIAHPSCRYLANSGVHRLYREKGRWDLMERDAKLFREVLNANTPHLAVENSIMHKHARRIINREFTFTTQPWQFGDNYTKRSCWWLKGLPKLQPTSAYTKEQAVHDTMRFSPGPERARLRAVTEQGIANAIAAQWGLFVERKLKKNRTILIPEKVA